MAENGFESGFPGNNILFFDLGNEAPDILKVPRGHWGAKSFEAFLQYKHFINNLPSLQLENSNFQRSHIPKPFLNLLL